MATWLPQSLLSAAEQRDFLSGVQPYVADLQKQVQSGITGLTQTAKDMARQSLPPAITGYLDQAQPGAPALPSPTPPMAPRAATPSPAPSAIEPFTLPTFESLTGASAAASAPTSAPAGANAAGVPRNSTDRSPFTLPTWQDLTGFAEPVRPAESPPAPTAPISPSGAASAGARPGAPATAGPPVSPGVNGGQPVSPGVTGDQPVSAPAGPIDNSSRASFVKTAWPHMLAAAGGKRDAAEMMLATAISENGSIGSGKPIWANNMFGIKGKGDAGSANAATWEQTASGPVGIRDDFAAYSTPESGAGAFFRFLQENSRYAPALRKYEQSGDATQLFQDVNAAGYATDPQWASKVANIRDRQVAPITRGLADVAAPAPAADARQSLHPRAAAAFEQANGRPPTPDEVAEMARLGLG